MNPLRKGRQAVAATVVSGGVFMAAQAIQSLPGLELTPEIWDFIFWLIGAGGIGGGMAVKRKSLTAQGPPP